MASSTSELGFRVYCISSFRPYEHRLCEQFTASDLIQVAEAKLWYFVGAERPAGSGRERKVRHIPCNRRSRHRRERFSVIIQSLRRGCFVIALCDDEHMPTIDLASFLPSKRPPKRIRSHPICSRKGKYCKFTRKKGREDYNR
jgi:hypothetical protein